MPDGGPFGPASVVVFGLMAAVAWGAADFGGGILGKRVPVSAVVLGMQLVGFGGAVVLMLLRGEALPSAVDAGWAALSGVLGALGVLALYAGLAIGRMGVVAPVTGVLAATVPVVVGIALEGLPQPIVLGGIAAAVLAVVLVSRVADPAGARSGIEFGLAAGLGIGLFNVTVTRVDPTLVFGPLVVVRLTAAVVTILVLVVRRDRPGIPRNALWGVAAVGLLDLAGNAGFLFAESTGSLAVAAVLSSLYPVGTILLAALILNERITRDHAVGIALAVVAIGMLTAGTV